MNSSFSFLKRLLAGLALGVVALAGAGAQTVSPLDLPLYFEAGQNRGEFFSTGSGYQFLISADGVRIGLRDSGSRAATAEMEFAGANAQAKIGGKDELAGKVNYLVGDDASKWQTGLPTFAKVQVTEIYPGISLVFHGNQQQLEYDFAIAPGANPNVIKIHFEGVNDVSVTPQGELVVKIGDGEIRQPAPEIYQIRGGARKVVGGGYQMLDARTVGFAAGHYDRSLPLVIDPVLSYSTYFGSTTRDTGWAIALGTNDCVYIAGQTLSKAFSASGAFQTNYGGGLYAGDAFVAKFGNPATNLIYLTYLGGKGDDAAYGLAVDAAGNAFVTGYTESTNFPYKNAITNVTPNGAYNGSKLGGKRTPTGIYFADAFVAELSASGSNLIYSTYLGGEASDAAYGIALDASDDAYVTGFTYSTNFPVTPNALQRHLACRNNPYANANAFVSEITNGGGALVYSTYLGGTNYDFGRAIAVDTNNYVYVAGYTQSTNFPVWNTPTKFPSLRYLNGATNGAMNTINGRKRSDAFVTKFPPLATQPPSSRTNLIYSTFLGGTNDDVANGIAVDGSGNAYVTGWTSSTNFPVTSTPPGLFSYLTTNGVRTFPVATNVFLTKISPDGSQILDSTVFGGRRIDIGSQVAVDAAGDAFVVGTENESTTNFPTVNAFGSLLATNSMRAGVNDAFVTAISSNWSSVYYSVCIGGRKNTYGYGIAVDDATTNVYITGITSSTNFPTQNASRFWFKGTNFIAGTNYINGDRLSGTTDAFLAVIAFAPTTPVVSSIQPTNQTVGMGATATFSVTVSGATGQVTYQWQTNGINLKNAGNFGGVNTSTLIITNAQVRDSSTNYGVIVSYGPGLSITNSDATLTVTPYPTLITVLTNQTVGLGSTVTFTITASGKPLIYGWTTNYSAYSKFTFLKNNKQISGATSNTLTIKDVQTNDSGYYTVLVGFTDLLNNYGEASTNDNGYSAYLTVLPTPLISTAPTNQTVGLGATVNFSVMASGNPVYYLWSLNGQKLTNGNAFSGVTDSILTITNAQMNDAGSYTVKVYNNLDSTNVSAILTVLSAPYFTFPSKTGNIGLVLRGVGGTNDGTYFVLTSTNLLTPLDLWTPIATNQFVGSQGEFAFTNAEDTNVPAAFYILKEK